MAQPLMEFDRVSKWYPTAAGTVRALTEVSFSVAAGEMVAILGASGSGKTTLLNLLGCLDRPTRGRYRLAGRAVDGMTDRQLAAIRNRTVGFVFQSFHLLPQLTAQENVELPLLYRGLPEKRRRRIAAECLDRVGLAARAGHRPEQLSGGQQQRVAIARALAGDPAVLLADEPTGNLDTAAGQSVMALLEELHRNGSTVVLITHDPRIGASCPRRMVLSDGRLAGG